MRLAVILLALFGAGLAATPPACASIVDEILELYDPDLVTAKATAQCVLDGGGINACMISTGTTQLKNNGDFQNIMAVAKAVDDKNYPLLVEKAGLAAACAWIEFPSKEVVCSELAGAVIDAGKKIATASLSVVEDAAAAAKLVSAGAKAVVCFVSGCSSSGPGFSVKVDGKAMWANCYQNRLAASVRARLGGAATWLERTDTSLAGARFKPGSLAATCSNATMDAFAGASKFLAEPETQAAIAGQLRVVHMTMTDKYRTVVEEAAARVMTPTAAAYTAQQNAQFNKASIAGAELFTQSGSLELVLTGERNACLKALSTPEATSLSRWAEGANAANTSSAIPGFTASGWPTTYAPQPWCANAYISAVQKDIVRRRDLRDKAVAAGCAVNGRDPRRFSCPAVGSAASLCQEAFKGGSGFVCDRSTIRLSPTPVKPAVAPPPANVPNTVTPTKPPPATPATPPVLPIVPRAAGSPLTTEAPKVDVPKNTVVRPNCYP